jgi:hypothetical protein
VVQTCPEDACHDPADELADARLDELAALGAGRPGSPQILAVAFNGVFVMPVTLVTLGLPVHVNRIERVDEEPGELGHAAERVAAVAFFAGLEVAGIGFGRSLGHRR